jgi:hypothetical protein
MNEWLRNENRRPTRHGFDRPTHAAWRQALDDRREDRGRTEAEHVSTNANERLAHRDGRIPSTRFVELERLGEPFNDRRRRIGYRARQRTSRRGGRSDQDLSRVSALVHELAGKHPKERGPRCP